MQELQGATTYKVGEGFSDTGQVINVDYSYDGYDSLDEAVKAFGGEVGALQVLNQVEKENKGNNARGKAKVTNGHDTRQPMTAEAKAKLKEASAKNRNALKILKGLSADQLAELGITL